MKIELNKLMVVYAQKTDTVLNLAEIVADIYFYEWFQFSERKMLSKLRLGILPIRMETARYVRPVIPENQRFCYCNNGEIESETHFLLSCPMYSELRSQWTEKLHSDANFDTLSVYDKFNVALNHPKNVRRTAKFIIKAMDLRSLLNTQY